MPRSKSRLQLKVKYGVNFRLTHAAPPLKYKAFSLFFPPPLYLLPSYEFRFYSFIGENIPNKTQRYKYITVRYNFHILNNK